MTSRCARTRSLLAQVTSEAGICFSRIALDCSGPSLSAVPIVSLQDRKISSQGFFARLERELFRPFGTKETQPAYLGPHIPELFRGLKGLTGSTGPANGCLEGSGDCDDVGGFKRPSHTCGQLS